MMVRSMDAVRCASSYNMASLYAFNHSNSLVFTQSISLQSCGANDVELAKSLLKAKWGCLRFCGFSGRALRDGVQLRPQFFLSSCSSPRLCKASHSRKSWKVYCLQDSVEDDRSRLVNEARFAVVENLIAAGIEEDVALSISENCPHFIEKLMERANEADEIVRWANLSLRAEVEGSSTNGLIKSLELSNSELWSVVLEYVGVRAQAVTRISHVLSSSTLTEFLKKVNFVEEALNRGQLDGQLFEGKVHQMMRRLSAYAYEDVQHTLSFFEKMAAQRGGIALLARAQFAVARLVEGFPHIFLRDLDVELKSVLTFLETLGVPDDSIGKVIVLFPPVLLCDPDRDLQVRLRTLKKIGVRARDLGKMIGRYPWLLSQTAQNNVDELVEFLISVKVPKGEIDRSITACPQLLGCSTVRTLQPMVERMNKLGVKSKRLGYVIAASPQLLVRSPDEFNEVINFLLKIGVEEKDLGGILKRHPGVFASDVKSVLEPKVQFLRQLGMKEELLFRVLRFFPEMLTMRIKSLRSRVKYLQDEGFHNEVICCMICRFPPLLSYNSESVLKPKLEFLVNSMGRSIYEVVEYPRYFSYSLEVKIKPRARVIELGKVKCSLREMLHLNDDQFASKFFGVGRIPVPPS